ncbi:MAG: AAA family ATPase [Clostridia bacterium]|nr:AAA family ATPase [Clostridia bacterium]
MSGLNGRNLGLGKSNFKFLQETNAFYVDKTQMIVDWWHNNDDVTLITRPRRFGKTLMMSTIEHFFSLQYAEDGEKLFGHYAVWQDETLRNLQGKFPVISLSFMGVEPDSFSDLIDEMRDIVAALYNQYQYLLDRKELNEREYAQIIRLQGKTSTRAELTSSIAFLSNCLYKCHGVGPIILIDEDDVVLQKAFSCGYWKSAVTFFRSLLGKALKGKGRFTRAILTGVTRISKESIFSDLNHLAISSVTTPLYSQAFGFTRSEVEQAMQSYGFSNFDDVKDWYDGYHFGNAMDIYNPWSILNYLRTGVTAPYWVNTSSNELVSDLVRLHANTLDRFSSLLQGNSIAADVMEDASFRDLEHNESAIWGILLSSGYLRSDAVLPAFNESDESSMYDDAVRTPMSSHAQRMQLSIPNGETRLLFSRIVEGWFSPDHTVAYIPFIEALLRNDLAGMNTHMQEMLQSMFSYFDTDVILNRKEKKTLPSAEATVPERFFHGFVLGLMVQLRKSYSIESNTESGLGRFDVALIPKAASIGDFSAYIFEFKIQSPEDASLHDTAKRALNQIQNKAYDTKMVQLGIPKDKIHRYGFGFHGKRVVITGD